MNEQQQEQPQEYGMDYAMHRHDVERIETRYNEDDYGTGKHKVLGANTLLRINGWVLLAIGQQGNMEHGLDPVYIMGVPRPKFCEDRHEDTQMIWHHETKRWVCKECDHKAAISDDYDNDNPPTAF